MKTALAFRFLSNAALILATSLSTLTAIAGEPIKHDIQGISLGMPLLEALSILKQKGCAVKTGKELRADRRGVGLDDMIECTASGDRDEFVLYYSSVLNGNPVWTIRYIFSSKLMREQLCSAVGYQFGFVPAHACSRERLDEHVTLALTTSETYRYGLELRDADLLEADEREYRRKLEQDNPPPRF